MALSEERIREIALLHCSAFGIKITKEIALEQSEAAMVEVIKEQGRPMTELEFLDFVVCSVKLTGITDDEAMEFANTIHRRALEKIKGGC